MHIISIKTFRIKFTIYMKLRNKTTEQTHFGFFYVKSKHITFIAIICYLSIWNIVSFPWLLAYWGFQKYKYNTQKPEVIHMRWVVSHGSWASFIFNKNGMEYLFYCIPNLFDVCLNFDDRKSTRCHWLI